MKLCIFVCVYVCTVCMEATTPTDTLISQNLKQSQDSQSGSI